MQNLAGIKLQPVVRRLLRTMLQLQLHSHSATLHSTRRSRAEKPPSSARTAENIRRASLSREHSLWAVLTLGTMWKYAAPLAAISERNRARWAGGGR